jgi:hypothetical protein
MSSTIPQAFVQQWDDTIRLLAQQKDSRFQGAVLDRGTITGESFTCNMLATVDELDEDNTRHGDTIWSDIEHSTRVGQMRDFFKAFPVDRADEPKLLVNPTGAYTERLMNAKNLRIDKIVYNAARGLALTKSGATVPLPVGQKIAHGGTGFTKAKIIQAKKMFRAAEADEYNGEELFMAFNSAMLEDVLADTSLTSADFMAVKMLQEGDISGKWMGFKWVPYERLEFTALTYYAIAWAKSGIHFGTGFTEGNASRRADKKNTLQVSMAASYGAVRSEEVKVVEIAFQ